MVIIIMMISAVYELLMAHCMQFSSIQSLDRLGHCRDMRNHSAETLFQSFLQKALVSSCDIGRDVNSLMSSIQHFLCQSQCCPPSKVPWRMVLERLDSMWHAQTLHVSVSWQLPEEAPVDPQGSWSCSTPSHWCCAPCRRCGEIS